VQSVLHALFLPTPFKSLQPADSATPESAAGVDARRPRVEPGREEEVLKPGALYAECAVVQLAVPPLPPGPADSAGGAAKSAKPADGKAGSAAKGKAKAKDEEPEEGLGEMPDDGELGGVALGTAVWDAYERALKAWEAAEPPPPPDAQEGPVEGNAQDAGQPVPDAPAAPVGVRERRARRTSETAVDVTEE
jgi:hypothetical protein